MQYEFFVSLPRAIPQKLAHEAIMVMMQNSTCPYAQRAPPLFLMADVFESSSMIFRAKQRSRMCMIPCLPCYIRLVRAIGPFRLISTRDWVTPGSLHAEFHRMMINPSRNLPPVIDNTRHTLFSSPLFRCL